MREELASKGWWHPDLWPHSGDEETRFPSFDSGALDGKASVKKLAVSLHAFIASRLWQVSVYSTPPMLMCQMKLPIDCPSALFISVPLQILCSSFPTFGN